MEDSFGVGLALSASVESHPILAVLRVKRPDGLFLLRVEVQFLHRHLRIDDLVGNRRK